MNRAKNWQQVKHLVTKSKNQSKKPTVASRTPARAAPPVVPGQSSVQDKPPASPLQAIRKSDLPPDRRWLVELMQKVGFGTVNGLAVRKAQPMSSPKPKVVYSRRLAGPDQERPEKKLNDFILKEPVMKLFKMFDHVQDGQVLEIVVRDGLPQEVKFEGFG